MPGDSAKYLNEADCESFKHLLDLPNGICLLPGPNADLATLLPNAPSERLQQMLCAELSLGRACTFTKQAVTNLVQFGTLRPSVQLKAAFGPPLSYRCSEMSGAHVW